MSRAARSRLPRSPARPQLAVQSDEPASVLRERVTSKGGTTAAALASFDAQGVKAAIVKGVRAADARAKEMGDELGGQ